eukprot:TRINITY_DN643_c0_g1_i4.p1 TRINITY_DN643_c0_g1~~TRINITY_DN643_c0_g1_i4.p1  ORF type:complete len:1384 (-),score=259.29 TRINITY_DN643_c0_g1_i4:25-4176(-)
MGDANSGTPNKNEKEDSKRRKRKQKNINNNSNNTNNNSNTVNNQHLTTNDETWPRNRGVKVNVKQEAETGGSQIPESLKLSIFYQCVPEETKENLRIIFSKYGTLLYTQTLRKHGNIKSGLATFSSEEPVQILLEKGKIHYKFDKARYLKLLPFTPKPGSWYHDKLCSKEDEIIRMSQEPTIPARKDCPHDIQVSSSIVEGSRVSAPHTRIVWELKIQNRTNMDRIFYKIICPHPNLTIYDNIPKRLKSKNEGLTIKGHQTHISRLIYTSDDDYGIQKFDLRLEGRNWAQNHQLIVQIAKQEEINLVSPQAEFDQAKADSYGLYDGIIREIVRSGRKLDWVPPPSNIKWARELGLYPVPEEILQSVTDKGHFTNIVPWRKKETHKQKQHELLWIEQVQMGLNLRKFDIANAELEIVESFNERGQVYFFGDTNPLAKLYAPGIAEKRPSVMKGDTVYAWIPGSKDKEYEGIVRHTDSTHVYVAFNFSLHNMLKGPNRVIKWNIRFELKHTDILKFRRMHSAVDEANLIWPDRPAPVIQNKKLHTWCDVAVQKDPFQAEVVKKIVNMQRAPMDSIIPPILLFGAFGTGKSRTIAEAIRQILCNSHPERPPKVLVCTVTNSAVDLFMDLLIDFPAINPQTLFRLYPAQRNVPEKFLPYTRHDPETNTFGIPTAEQLREYNVILSTAETSHNLYRRGMNKGDFTHIILDEAAQMLETEALIPLILADDRCIVVMSGDTKQLGPTIYSKSAKLHKLDRSLMERIATHYVDDKLLSELRMNYRSSSSLGRLCSLLFYDNKLKPSQLSMHTNRISEWPKLHQNTSYLMEHIEGQDQREGDSPSFFNLEEAFRVAELVQDLLHWAQKKHIIINQQDIAVITPYLKQSQKIRSLLRSRRLNQVAVMNVDEMPGKEYPVVFLSTVRASTNWSEFDLTHDLGVIHNSKRMCTALTRAKECLVIVGDTFVLSEDEKWRTLIEEAKREQAYIGTDTKDEQYKKEREQIEMEKTEGVETAAKAEDWALKNKNGLKEEEVEKDKFVKLREGKEEEERRDAEGKKKEKERRDVEEKRKEKERRDTEKKKEKERRDLEEQQRQVKQSKSKGGQPISGVQTKPIEKKSAASPVAPEKTKKEDPVQSKPVAEVQENIKNVGENVGETKRLVEAHLNDIAHPSNNGQSLSHTNFANGFASDATGSNSNNSNYVVTNGISSEDNNNDNTSINTNYVANGGFGPNTVYPPNFAHAPPVHTMGHMGPPPNIHPQEYMAMFQSWMNMMQYQRSTPQYQTFYTFAGRPLIQLEEGCSCPPLSVFSMGDGIEVKIDSFGMRVNFAVVQEGVFQVTLVKEMVQEENRKLLYTNTFTRDARLLINFSGLFKHIRTIPGPDAVQFLATNSNW